MTQATFTYDVTFCDGVTIPVAAHNKSQASPAARAIYARWFVSPRWAAIAIIERRPRHGKERPELLYCVHLSGSDQTRCRMTVTAQDATAAIAGARHALAARHPAVPVMSTIVVEIESLGLAFMLNARPCLQPLYGRHVTAR